ncbi:hypothetical protein AVEN_59376-1 [Araneus ventricosus]|uniref:Uncharacterized protein n=1 Tax=Araneus ventricosus TaxID=182803 RepID=A0A4Y2TEZ9_ARAVE|nr:hypothetical protein AVEN_59376-1 [Araneus ventricosus]
MVSERRFFQDFPIGYLTNHLLCEKEEVCTAFGGLAGKGWRCIQTIVNKKVIGKNELFNGSSSGVHIIVVPKGIAAIKVCPNKDIFSWKKLNYFLDIRIWRGVSRNESSRLLCTSFRIALASENP